MQYLIFDTNVDADIFLTKIDLLSGIPDPESFTTNYSYKIPHPDPLDPRVCVPLGEDAHPYLTGGEMESLLDMETMIADYGWHPGSP